MSPFLNNLILFSPLLFLAAAILYVIERADHLRRGAGLPVEAGGDILPADTAEELLLHEDEELPEESGEDINEDETVEGDVAFEGELPGPPDDVGPAQPARRIAPRTRNVGTKKARSIARRDQRRAYHEFLHTQAAARAEEEKALRQEEEERAFENARKRALAEEEIAARREKGRLQKQGEERKEKESERRDAETIKKAMQGKRAVDLRIMIQKTNREKAWLEALLKREGFLGQRGENIGMLTNAGWWVDIGPAELQVLWDRLEGKGRMEWKQMGGLLEEVMQR